MLLFESPGRDVLDGPDNMTTSPGGAIVICEDGNLRSNFVRALLPDGSLISIAENLVGVQKHYIEASGKLWDPTVPDDGASGRRRDRALGVRRPDVQPRRAVAVREHPGARHHLCDHRAVG